MKNPQDHLKTLGEIRSLMERSSRFLSLSGLSGISAGMLALIGVGCAYWYLSIDPFSNRPYYFHLAFHPYLRPWDVLKFLVLDAFFVLVLSLSLGIYFSWRKSKKLGLPIWDRSTNRLIINMFIPLVSGGLFCLILLGQDYDYIIWLPSLTLLFYGLALLNASNYTYRDIRYLGISEVILGLAAGIWIEKGLFIWTLGFGVLHIIYGSLMYFKYERKLENRKENQA